MLPLAANVPRKGLKDHQKAWRTVDKKNILKNEGLLKTVYLSTVTTPVCGFCAVQLKQPFWVSEVYKKGY